MLRRSALQGSFWTMLGNGSQQFLTLGTFIYLAHTLSAHDFGTMALASAVVDLLTLIGRFGQVEALLQRGPTGDEALSTSFWLSVLIGIAILVLIASIAFPFAHIYQTPAVASILLLLAPAPLIYNMGQVHEALLRREFRYQGIAFRNTGATLIGALVSVLLATHGYGVYALAFQKLAFNITYTGLVWIARPWAPKFELLKPEAKRLLATGRDMTISGALQLSNGRIMDVVVGYFLGVATLGSMRLAVRLCDFIVQLFVFPVTNVSISSMSHLSGDLVAVRGVFLRYVQLLMLLTLPLFVGTAIIAPDIVLTLAGPKWNSVANILSWLVLVGPTSVFVFLFGPTMVVANRTSAIRKQGILQTVVTAATVVISAQFSLLAVLIVHLMRCYTFAGINVVIVSRTIGFHLRQVVSRIIPAFASTLVMAAVCVPLHRTIHGVHPLVAVALVTAAGLSVYGATLLLGDKLGLWPGLVADLTAFVKGMRRREAA